MCGRTEEEAKSTVGLQRHRHFVGFFNVPVQAPTRGQSFYKVIPRNRPILVAFYDTLGKRRSQDEIRDKLSKIICSILSAKSVEHPDFEFFNLHIWRLQYS